MRTCSLLETCELDLSPTLPFHFRGTVWKKSHFPSPLESFDGKSLRFSMRVEDAVVGVRLEETDCSRLRAVVFSSRPLSDERRFLLANELRWRFDLDAELQNFYEAVQTDPVLGPVVDRWRGMRVKCAQSLYELLTIGVVLQNATVRRSVQMLKRLLDQYGVTIAFDDVELSAFWLPREISAVPDEALRALKVGYRSKFLLRQAHQFADADLSESHLRELPGEVLRQHLLSIFGVGPATTWILEFEAFHRYDSIDHISPWENKIYSQLLFGEQETPKETILRRIEPWRPWRMLGMHYLFEDLFWRHDTDPISWLSQLIRL